MTIGGFQKLTLLDYPEKTACTVFVRGCNLRCPFCHNSTLVLANGNECISENDIFSYLNKRKGLIDGVCVTGGEPLIMKDIEEFLYKIKSLSFSVKLDTNGFYPDKLIGIVKNGLCDYVAMDVKNTPEKYPVTVGKTDIDVSLPLKSIEFLKCSGIEHEFRTTVTKTFHTKDDVLDIARLLGENERYYLQPFVNSGALIDDTVLGYSRDELEGMLNELKKIIPKATLRG